MIIYSTQSYSYFANLLVQQTGFNQGWIDSDFFPDGESYHRIETSPQGQNVILVGGAATEFTTLELFDLACALIEQGAKRLSLVVPYYGYSTMERATRLGEVVKAKTRAILLSAIPRGAGNNRIIMLDLHSEGIPYYFSSNVNPVHLYGKNMVFEATAQFGGQNFILASTDAGRAKWVESLANDLNVPSAFVYKRRLSGSETAITGINADVKGKIVIIYDDMIRTGGSLLKAAKAYKEAGADRIYVITTHLLLTSDIRDRLQAEGLITKIVGSNSHPNSQNLENGFLLVKDVSSIFAQYLKNELLW